MRKLAFVLLVIFLQGCMTGTPNNIKESKSKFDGSREVLMEPGFVFLGRGTFDGSDFKLGAHWSSAAPDVVTLKAEIQSVIVNIQSAEGLQFNIDGEFVKITSPQVATDFESKAINNVVYKNSSKRFPVSIALFDRILAANTVMAKLVTSDGYLDGELTADKTSAAIRGLRAFKEKVGGRLP